MDRIEKLVSSSDWLQVVSSLDEQWLTENPTVKELFYYALAAYAQDDLASAYKYGKYAFEQDGEIAEISEFMAVISVFVGREKESYFYRKMLSVQSYDDELQTILPNGIIPDYTDALSKMVDRPLLSKGVSEDTKGNWDKAEHWFLQHIAMEPQDVNGHLALIGCQMEQERFRSAFESLKSARTLFPVNEIFACLMGEVLIKLGMFDHAEGAYKWAMECGVPDARIHLSYIRAMTQNPYKSFKDCVHEMQLWSQMHAQEMKGMLAPAQLGSRSLLKIGFFVKGMDRMRAAPAFGEVLSFHNDSEFYFIGYGEGNIAEPFNRCFKTSFNEWRDIHHADPMTLRNMVLADGIDILIDMGGLSSSETLSCFGTRLAPLQLSWSDNSLAAILPTFDYVIGDEIAEPLGEKKVSLPGTAILCAGRGKADLSPCVRDDRFTFVADASFVDLNVETLTLWAKVLLANPEATLLLRSHDFFSEDNSRALIEKFGIFGIAHRVDVIQESDRRVFFMQGDVALLPSYGGKADLVLDAFDAGIPMLGCRETEGQHSDAIVLLEEIASDLGVLYETGEAFVQGSIDWATDTTKVTVFKGKIQEALECSLFSNSKERMKEIEQLLRTLWEQKLDGEMSGND